jgi:hypothetical protein
MFSKRLHRRNILQIIGILPLFATSVDIALADDPKTSISAVKYRRYDDPAGSGDVYKIPEVVLASASAEVKGDGCKTGPDHTLIKSKLIDAGDTDCPNGVIPNHFTIVIPGVVETVQGDVVTVSYEITGGVGAKRTITLPKNSISKKQGITLGSEVFIYPEMSAFKKNADVVKDFNIFVKKMNEDPFKIDNTTKFSVQLK